MQKYDLWSDQKLGAKLSALKTEDNGRFYLVSDVEKMQEEITVRLKKAEDALREYEIEMGM